MHVALLPGREGKAGQAVHHANGAGILLNLGHEIEGRQHQVVVDALLNYEQLLFGIEDFLLIGFQLLGYVALGIHQRLLTNPLGGHFVLMRICNFEIVAKHLVISHFKRRNAGVALFALLELQQVVFARKGQGAQLVQLRVDARVQHAALVGEDGRVGLDFGEDFLAQVGAGVELVGQFHEGLHAGSGQPLAHGGHGLQGAGQLQQLARVHAAHGHFGNQAFQVVYLAQVLSEVAEQFLIGD